MSVSQAAFRFALPRGSDWTSFTSSGSPIAVRSAARVSAWERTAVIGDHLLLFWYSQPVRALQARSKHGQVGHRRLGCRSPSSAALLPGQIGSRSPSAYRPVPQANLGLPIRGADM